MNNLEAFLNSKKIGYARVSTEEQNLDMQIEALKKAGCDDIYFEKASGYLSHKNKDAQPELQAAIRALREGDTLIVWKLDRLGRRASRTITLLEDLRKRNITFLSLTEQISTSGMFGDIILKLIAILAELDRNQISERTRAGMAHARAKGRIGGRKFKLNPSQVQQMLEIYDNPDRTQSARNIAALFNISERTLYYYYEREQEKKRKEPTLFKK